MFFQAAEAYGHRGTDEHRKAVGDRAVPPLPGVFARCGGVCFGLGVWPLGFGA